MKITPINYGFSTLPESMIFKGGSKERLRPITFTVYLIETGGKRILVDAGCVTMPGFDMEDFRGAPNALRDMGVSPDTITDLVLTHAHHDHAECVEYYKNATVYIQKDEYEKGKKYIPESTPTVLFDDELLICEGVKAIKIGGHSKGSCIVEIQDGNRISVIVGDECYLSDCIEKQIPTGASVCPERSQQFIEKYSDKKYNLLYCHDNF